MRRVLIDCDPGIDDALAILLALGARRKIDVKAIVSTFGNVPLEQTKNNLLRILSFFNTIPIIGYGSKGPLKGRAPVARFLHGKDGLGPSLNDRKAYPLGLGVFLPIDPKKAPKVPFRNGVDLIIKSALSKEIDTIVATGPLTDLARAIKRRPAFIKHIDEIIIMGGAVFVRGNVTPHAEFNFYCDPQAARIVLNADVKKTLVSLDVTQKALLTKRHIKEIKGSDRVDKTGPLGFITHLAEYSIWANRRRGFNGAPMHDPLAVGLAIDKGLGEYEDLCLDVETAGKERGKAVLKSGRPNVRFCKKVNTEKFFSIFIGTLVKLSKSVQ